MSSSQSLAPLMESNDSEPSSQVLIRDLISVFVESVMRLNHLRGNSGSSPQTEPSESKVRNGWGSSASILPLTHPGFVMHHT